MEITQSKDAIINIEFTDFLICLDKLHLNIENEPLKNREKYQNISATLSENVKNVKNYNDYSSFNESDEMDQRKLWILNRVVSRLLFFGGSTSVNSEIVYHLGSEQYKDLRKYLSRLIISFFIQNQESSAGLPICKPKILKQPIKRYLEDFLQVIYYLQQLHLFHLSINYPELFTNNEKYLVCQSVIQSIEHRAGLPLSERAKGSNKASFYAAHLVRLYK